MIRQSTRSDGKGGFIRDIFPGNIIPPEPAQSALPRDCQIHSGAECGRHPAQLQHGGLGARTSASRTRLLTKLDQNFGSKNRLAFTWSRNGEHFNYAYDDNPENPANWSSIPYPLGGRKYYNGDQYYGNVFRLNDTHLITPQLINILTLGAHRLTHPEHDRTAVPFGQAWGDKLNGAVGNNPYYNYSFPPVTFQTDSYYGWDSSKLWDEYHTVYGLDENLSWVKRSHSFKFGYSFQLLMLNTNNRNNAAGNFAFNRLETSAPADNSGNSGNAFASFMLGALHSGGFTVPNTGMLRFPYHAFFAQDDWKVTSRLTLNIGLRYELNVGAYEKHDRMSYFDPTLPNPAANGFPGALRFLGSGPGREGRRNLWSNATGWGPRIGLAYRITDSTVFRAGFGIFYASEKAPGLTPSNAGFTSSPSWSSGDQGITPAFYWDQGFPAWQAPPFINPAFNAGFGISWYPADEIAQLPSTQQLERRDLAGGQGQPGPRFHLYGQQGNAPRLRPRELHADSRSVRAAWAAC